MLPTSAPPGLEIPCNSVLGRPITLSPDRMAIGHRRNTSTGSVYSDDSDDTIDISDFDNDNDCEGQMIGFPLARMIQYDSLPSERDSVSEDEENESEGDDNELAALYRACMAARLESNHNSEDAGSESSDTSSVAWDNVDFEQLTDSLPEKYANNSEQAYVQLHPSLHQVLSAPLALQTLRLPGNSTPEDEDNSDSSILLLFLALNAPELRSDPWNPVPRILRAVERICGDHSGVGSTGSTVYLFHPPLVPLTQESEVELDKQTLYQGTVAQWIDFLRQVIEGLAFLHENGVVWGGFDAIKPLPCFITTPSRPPGLDSAEAKEAEMFMMDISSDPDAFVSSPKWTFDRSRYPVKYYFTNFRRARQISPPSIFNSASSSSLPFTQDVQSCGKWLEALVKDIHSLNGSLIPLTQAMTSGTFTADGARKLFEARVRSLNLTRDKSLWDNQVASVRWRPVMQPLKPSETEFKDRLDAKRANTFDVACSVPSRPGIGASRTSVTEATSVITKPITAIKMSLRPPGFITRSKSNPIPAPQENTRRGIFGDLSFAKTFTEEPISIQSEIMKDTESESKTTPTTITSPAPPSPLSFLNSSANSQLHHAKVSSSPVFNIPSLVIFPSSSPLTSLPEFSSPQQTEQPQHSRHHQQSTISQAQRKRRTTALGTGIFSRKTSQYAPSLGNLGSSNPTSLSRIGRSISMPVTVSSRVDTQP
ncbi:hypothetical protein J3R30DRAFT_3450867 [Lentinula aciculospora]|uniref:Uncharacterized protein n=1 Tax=Lentinula aciculospora TaxID=153920 RepID=A0A9W9DSL6_9AGAR|nr:hypothetical protein J3R30DRAFT_3450867 [Lentinula aciculospora]